METFKDVNAKSCHCYSGGNSFEKRGVIKVLLDSVLFRFHGVLS